MLLSKISENFILYFKKIYLYDNFFNSLFIYFLKMLYINLLINYHNPLDNKNLSNDIETPYKYFL